MVNNGFKLLINIAPVLALCLWLTAIYFAFENTPTGQIRNEAVSQMVSAGNKIRQVAFLTGALLSLVSMTGKPLPRSFYRFLLILSVFLLSSLWSIAPDYTIRRSIRFLCLGFVLLPLSVSRQRLFQAMGTILVFSLVICSVSLIGYARGLGLTDMGGEMRLQGVTPQPNALGPLALMGIILLCLQHKRPGVYFIGALAVLLSTLILTRSRSSYVAAFVFVAVYLATKSASHRFWVVSGIILLTMITTVAVGFFDVTEFWGRDLTFTGRTQVWNLTIQDWFTHPILGTGFGASYVPVSGSLFEKTLSHTNWATVHSHQEFLQLFNELGLLLAPFVLFVLLTGIPFRSRIALYVLVPLIPYILVETVIFDGTVFSIMFFLIYLSANCLKENRCHSAKQEFRSMRAVSISEIPQC